MFTVKPLCPSKSDNLLRIICVLTIKAPWLFTKRTFRYFFFPVEAAIIIWNIFLYIHFFSVSVSDFPTYYDGQAAPMMIWERKLHHHEKELPGATLVKQYNWRGLLSDDKYDVQNSSRVLKWAATKSCLKMQKYFVNSAVEGQKRFSRFQYFSLASR